MEKSGRNELCYCGSGKKYKHCHLKTDLLTSNFITDKNEKSIPRSKEYIEGMVRSCRLARRCLDYAETLVAPGVNTYDIDAKINKFMLDHNALPATLGYNGFPASSCISPNEVICHGIPSKKTILKEGDIVNIDVTTILNGYYGDVSKTFFVGECSPEAHKVSTIGLECLNLVREKIKPGMKVGDIGFVIQNHAHANNCSVVESFVGHSIGKKFHEEPQIPHFGKKNSGPPLKEGMFFTVEPMINLGTKNLKVLADGWTAVTADGKLSAQFEHTFMVTKKRLRALTDETEADPIFQD